MSDENRLPALADIVNDLNVYKKTDELNFLLNQEPPKAWVANHPIIKVKNNNGQRVPYQYLPIDKTEHLLRKIFKAFQIEVTAVNQLFNAVQVTVRVHYKDLVTGEWRYHDGVGAMHLQLNQGATAGDMTQVKSGAVMMATPLAKTLAIKDACDMFGTLFGANLNRRGVITATLDAKILDDEEKLSKIKSLYHDVGEQLSPDDDVQINRIINTEDSANYEKAIKMLSQLKSKTDA